VRSAVRLAATALTALAAAGCGPARAPLDPWLAGPLPAPLDSLPLASDVRIDSLGFLAGSFVGEGTARAVHLLSSDTAVIAELARRYAPELPAGPALWRELQRRGRVPVSRASLRRRTVAGQGPRVHLAIVGTPLGHTEVTVAGLALHGGGCGTGHYQAELVVADDPEPGDPALRGPVLGTLLSWDARPRHRSGMVRRPEAAALTAGVTDTLLARTGRSLDSALAERHPGLGLRPAGPVRIEVNTLADLDAADVIPIWSAAGVRYAVSLRVRRVSGPDTLVAAGVMLWDGAATRSRAIFTPTLFRVTEARLDPFEPRGRPVYWRRLQPISDAAYPRDDIWLEQVDVRDGRVIWGVIQPEENVVVAAAEANGGCS
jgi:hypothetical protein